MRSISAIIPNQQTNKKPQKRPYNLLIQNKHHNRNHINLSHRARHHGLFAPSNNTTNTRTHMHTHATTHMLKQASLDGADGDTVDIAALSQKLESISRVVRQTQAAAAVAAVSNAADPNSAAAVAAEVLQTAASDSSAQATAQAEAAKAPAIDELSLDDEGADDNRNKR